MTWLQADADADSRYRALDALPVTAASIPALLAALRDESWRVRRLAAERLGSLEPSHETIEQLVTLLGRRDDTGARNAAAAVLAQLGAPALSAIIALLRHADPDQRKFAADILGQLKRSEAVAPLVEALGDADPNVRTSAAEALGQIGGPDARRALEQLLSSRDVLLRVCALEGLASLESPVPLPQLKPLLSDPLTRRSAWRLLGHVRHPTAARMLVRALASRDTREAALGSLGASGQVLTPAAEAELRIALAPVADVATWLEAALASHDVDRRLGALRVAGALGDPRLALAVAGSTREGQGGELALSTLLRLGVAGARAILSSIEGLADLPGEARAVTADALMRLAEPSLCAPLVALLDAGDHELAELAVTALGRTHAREAIAPLVRCFEDDVLAAHAWRALVSLSESWPAEVREALAPLVTGPLRPHAVRAWAELMGPKAADVIKRGLHDASEAIRAAAAEAALFAPREAMTLLQAALMDESALVRRAAARAIGRLGRSPAPEDGPNGAHTNRSAGRSSTGSDRPEKDLASGRSSTGSDRPEKGLASGRSSTGSDRPEQDLASGRSSTSSDRPESSLLQRALRDPDPSVLALACASAGQLAAVDSSARLDELTRHADAAVALASLEALALLGLLTDEHLLRAAHHGDPEVVKLAFNLGADRPLLLDKALAALFHPRWDVRVAAARMLAVSAGREALAPLQDAVARETTDGVAHVLLDEAVETLSRRV